MVKAIACCVCIIGILSMLMATPGHAATYDKPLKVQTANSPEFGQIRCTYYADIMVLETESDQPGSGPASLLSGSPANLQCNDKRLVSGLKLTSSSYTFEGRRGAFLIFTATDPDGAVPFMVINMKGHVLYSDAIYVPGSAEDFDTVDVLPDGSLHLEFTRGVNASCSVLADATCWGKLGKDGSLPKAVSHLPPPKAACSAAYRKAKLSADSSSLIFYKVDMSLSATGKPHVNARGTLGCDFAP